MQSGTKSCTEEKSTSFNLPARTQIMQLGQPRLSKYIYDLQLLSALRNPFVMPSIWICDRSRVHIFFDQITGRDR
jgi:hypothetical protein